VRLGAASAATTAAPATPRSLVVARRCGSFAAISLACALVACGPKTRALEDGSKAPDSPRVPSSAVFEPKIGDFTTVEVFDVAPDRMAACATELVSGTLPVIRERGGVRDVWLMRDETNARFFLVSVWQQQLSFQQWQMSEQRIASYQKLGPFLVAQPVTQPVALIGIVAPRRP